MAAPARLLALVVVIVIASCLAVGAEALRSLGGRDGAGATAEGDAAVDLNATNFDALLRASSESFAVVEFFTHWCLACRNYKPHYEKVAKLFNGLEATHSGIILMARVDCALKVNMDLCNRFSVDRYPILFWGPATKYASAKWDRKQEKREIKLIDDGRTAERLLMWINKQMESSFSLDDKKHENVSVHPKMLKILNSNGSNIIENFGAQGSSPDGSCQPVIDQPLPSSPVMHKLEEY